MGLLTDRRTLITDLLSDRSIAYDIASAYKHEDAELAFTYVGERFKDHIIEFITELDSKPVLSCDINNDEQTVKVFENLDQRWGHFNGLVHSIGFVSREAITGSFVDGLSHELFRIARDISAYNFPALAKAVPPMFSPTASLLALTYPGAERIVPNYDAMGLTKAPLEADVRCLIGALGSKGIRTNGISADSIKTPAASGIKGFGKLLRYMRDVTPLRRDITVEEISNVTVFLPSGLTSGIAGEITYADYGLNVTTGVSGSVD